VEEALKLLLAGYLLVLSVAAVWGAHRSLLLLPARILYSILRIIVFVFSFGRIRMTPRARMAVLKGRRIRRNLRRYLLDLRREQIEEEDPSGGWVSEGDKSGTGPGA
jgi:hypothetical protein